MLQPDTIDDCTCTGSDLEAYDELTDTGTYLKPPRIRKPHQTPSEHDQRNLCEALSRPRGVCIVC